jgi:hypothetical protein
MKITDSIWFTSFGLIGCVGIVMGEDETTGQRKAYIGVAYGINESLDELIVAGIGAKFPAEIAERIAKWLKEQPTESDGARCVCDKCGQPHDPKLKHGGLVEGRTGS